MKEILFRGKDPDFDVWYYGVGVIPSSDKNIYSVIIGDRGENFRVIPESVGQFLGIEDGHGIKIFEGDYVRCLWGEEYCGVWESDEVVEAEFQTYALSCFAGAYVMEILGNRTDNPEMVEKYNNDGSRSPF